MEQSFSVRNLGRQVRRLLPVVLAAAVAGALLGALYSMVAPTSYKASSDVLLGEYALPSSVAMQGGIPDSGPLGIELPPDTLILLVPSPAVTDLAVKVNPGIGTSEEVGKATSVTAPTTNTVQITSSGRTAAQAVDRANAMAAGLAQYRKNVVQSQVTNTKTAISKTIDTRQKRIQELDAQLASKPDQSLAAERDDLAKANAADQSTLANLDGVLASFDGGVLVSQPASLGKAVRTPTLPLAATIGAIAGALLGLLGVLLWSALTGRLSAGHSRKFSVPVLLGEGDWARSASVPPALVPALLRRSEGDASRPVSVVTVSGDEVDAQRGRDLLQRSSLSAGDRGEGEFVAAGSLQHVVTEDLGAGRRVVLVANERTDRVEEVNEAVDGLKAVGARVVGLVVLGNGPVRQPVSPQRVGQ